MYVGDHTVEAQNKQVSAEKLPSDVAESTIHFMDIQAGPDRKHI